MHRPQPPLSAISRAWQVDIDRLRPDLPLSGSPERSTWRCVMEASDGRLFVLEQIASREYSRKRRIAETLGQLVEAGFGQAIAYLPAADGDYLPLIEHALWQMAPFVHGVYLDRPAYTVEEWRGDAAADCLLRLKAAGPQLTCRPATEPFSIKIYIHRLFESLSTADPQIASRYRPFLELLEEHLFPVHDRLPVGFCHGDFHPLNVIWGERRIRAVIDWEFCGIKPEAFDLANLLGCLGIEDPASLEGPLARRLIERLREADAYDARSWQALPDLMLAIRFAWLGEWLRKKDRQMIRMEADYMTWLAGGRLTFPANE